MSTSGNALLVLERALTMCQAKLAASSPQATVLVSTEKQLEYLISIVKGESTDRSRLKDIILGIYAVREFENDDPAFSNILLEADNHAKILRSGPWIP